MPYPSKRIQLRDHGLLKDSETEHLVHELEQYLQIVEASEEESATTNTELLPTDVNTIPEEKQ